MQRITVRATDFSRNFAKYQDEAISAKVINVTSHGRIVGGYLSADELGRYEALKRRAQEVLLVGALDDETVESLEQAQYGVEPQ